MSWSLPPRLRVHTLGARILDSATACYRDSQRIAQGALILKDANCAAFRTPLTVAPQTRDERGAGCGAPKRSTGRTPRGNARPARSDHSDVAELGVTKNGGGGGGGYVRSLPDDVANRVPEIEQEGGRGHGVGHMIPGTGDARTEGGTAVVTGVLNRVSRLDLRLLCRSFFVSGGMSKWEDSFFIIHICERFAKHSPFGFGKRLG